VASIASALPHSEPRCARARRQDGIIVDLDSVLHQAPLRGRLFIGGRAFGTQNYVCVPSASSTSGVAYALFTREAILFDEDLTELDPSAGGSSVSPLGCSAENGGGPYLSAPSTERLRRHSSVRGRAVTGRSTCMQAFT
jgi:hypothetical protein